MRAVALALAAILSSATAAAAPPVDAPLSTPTVDASKCPQAIRSADEMRERFADRPGRPAGVQYIECWVQEFGHQDEQTGETIWTGHARWAVGGRIGYHTPRGGGDCGATFYADDTLQSVGGGGGPCQDDEPRHAPPEFGAFAEGFASANEASGIRLRDPADPPFDYAELCPRAPRVTRLETSLERIRFAAGERWPLARFAVRAVDDHGRALPDVPIVLDLSRAEVGLDVSGEALRAEKPGRLRLRVRTVCAPNQRELVLPVEIVPADAATPSSPP